MFRFARENRYLLIVFCIHLLAIVLFTSTEIHRVNPVQQFDFLLLRFVNVFLIVSVIFTLLCRRVGDLFFAFCSILGFYYCIYSSWFLPLYEFAFFQMALVMCFVDYKKKWVYPALHIFGGISFLISQQIQIKVGRQIPVPTGQDYFFVILICLLLALILQRYVFEERLNKSQLFTHYGVIGREATRLLHDVKGMLGSPLMLAGGILNNQKNLNYEQQAEALRQLHGDLERVRDVVYNLNRLVSNQDMAEKVRILTVLKRSLLALGTRSKTIKIELPEDREFSAVSVKLESIFFNLMLNSIQANEIKKIKDAKIQIEWKQTELVYTDNVGESPLKAESSSSIGLVLIELDLKSMDIPYCYKLDKNGFEFRMNLKDKLI